ncbi:MAG: hypothetical protein HN474_07080 [Nitrospina sp.]|nr:hypothetical protein [Nitrospina sp.]
MPLKLTLNRLAENLILESNTPFSSGDFEKTIREKWQQEIPISTLKRLKKKLFTHNYLIEKSTDDFLPIPVALQKIKNLSLSIRLNSFEINKKVFFPGHRLIPFISNEKKEPDLTFLCPEGNEVKKQKLPFLIEDIVPYYQYSSPIHFPDEIKINNRVLEKSSLLVMAWDITHFIHKNQLKEGDFLCIKLIDYKKGVFQIQPCLKSEMHIARLKMRSLFVSMETILAKLCTKDSFCAAGLEKQLLCTLYHIDNSLLNIPAFSLVDFIESLTELEIIGCEAGGGKLVSGSKNHLNKSVCEEKPRVSKGVTGSLDKIFQDLKLAFNKDEFVSILYTIMGSDTYKLESVFNILFGGEGKIFNNQNQHEVFYKYLRKLLKKICLDLKQPESKAISALRDETVSIKLSLIEILRFLEKNEVGLKDLPQDLLDKIYDLDHFCRETLCRLADRSAIPNLKFIHDAKLAIKIILPHAAYLEEEVYSQLGFY